MSSKKPKRKQNKFVSFLLQLFMAIVIGVWLAIGLWWFVVRDDMGDEKIVAFCDLRSDVTELIEVNGELAYYTSLLETSPKQIRPEVATLQNEKRSITEIQRSGDLAALFNKLYGELEISTANFFLNRYTRENC